MGRSTFDLELAASRLPFCNGFYLSHGSADIIRVRHEREQKARLMLSAAATMGALLRRFPFVQAAFLSGALSKGVATKGADVDLFIITSEQRLWISRTFLTAFKKFFLLNSKKFFCLNYFITEEHLEIPEKNIYSATELLTLRPPSTPERT